MTGIRLYIDNAVVSEMWRAKYTAFRKYTLKAEKGKKYAVKIEYMQRSGMADLNFSVGVRKPVDFAGTAANVKMRM